MDQEKIGTFMKNLRKENGLTQEQFAEKLGVSQKSVSRWETGKTMPDYSLLPGICEILGINVAELLNAERIEGDTISKTQVTDFAQNMILLMNDRRNIRKMIGALMSVVLMFVCMIGLYRYEFHVSVESTADLERAINEYHFQDEVSSDVLERQAIGKYLYVLYGENEYPGACGLACLEKGIFGRYRIISCDDTDSRWVNVRKVAVGKKNYCVTYCVNDLSGIDSYDISGLTGETGANATVDDSYVFAKIYISKIPFLDFTEIPDNTTISPFHIQYYHDNEEVANDELEMVLGEHFIAGAPNGGGGTAELGMIYVLECIIFIIGIIFIRYFLTDIRKS